MKTAPFCLLALLVLLLPAAALAQHADVRPGVAGGRLVTDGYIDDTQATLPGLRVFGYDFQEDPLDPYFAADPGFNALAGSGLPPGSQLLFRVSDGADFGLPSNLAFWDGMDSDSTAPGTQPSFGTPANAESLRLNLGSRNLAVGTALGRLAGFTLQNVADNGSVHLHLGTFLERAGGALPTDGIYLFSLALLSGDPHVAESAPLFFVFNNGLREDEHDLAIEWVQENLVTVPEPSSLVLGIAALLALFTRRLPRQSLLPKRCQAMNRAMLVRGTAAVLLVGPSAQAQVVDVRPRVFQERIATDGFIDATSQTIPDHRLFLYNFGEYPSDPFFSTEPGFNAPAGSGLLPESALGFNVLDGSLFSWDANLVFWNGEDMDPKVEGLQVSFGPAPTGETLSLKLSSNAVTVGSELGELPGFTIQTVSASGSVHRHLSSFLEAAETDEPATGLYLFAIELVSSAALEDSLPAFLLYANGVGAKERSAAAAWIDETLIAPLPGDANLDGQVDLADFGILKANFGKEGTRTTGDFDADGHVSLTDFGLLKENFGRTRAGLVVVPEPSTDVIAATLLLLLGGVEALRRLWLAYLGRLLLFLHQGLLQKRAQRPCRVDPTVPFSEAMSDWRTTTVRAVSSGHLASTCLEYGDLDAHPSLS